MGFDRRTWLRLAGLCAVLLASAGCTTSSNVSTQYYEISGNSASALDREIMLKGPDEGRAIAQAAIQIVPVRARAVEDAGRCRFARVNFRVHADITLPRWREERVHSDPGLRRVWRNFAGYARAHEEAHVRIAESYAQAMERSLLAIPPQPNCGVLVEEAVARMTRIGESHVEAQNAFDVAEQARLRQLMAEGRRGRRS